MNNDIDNIFVVENNVVNNEVVNSNEFNNNVNANKKNINIKIIIIIVFGVFLLAIMGIVFCFAFVNFSKSNNVNNIVDSSFDLEDEYYFDKDKVVFKDISFLKNYSNSSIVTRTNINKVWDYIEYYDDLYDLDGNKVFDSSQYDSVEFELDYIIVVKDRKYGLLDKSFNLIVPIEYYDIEIMSESCVFLEKNTNNFILSEIYNPKINKKYGLFSGVDYLSDDFVIGKNLINDFENLSTYNGSVEDREDYLINLVNDSYKILDLDNYSFLWSSLFQNKYFIAQKFGINFGKSGVCLFDFNFNEVINCKYDEIVNIDDEFLLLVNNDYSDLVTVDNKTIISSLENVDTISLINDIIYISFEDGSESYYNKNGNLLYRSLEYVNFHFLKDDKYLLTNNEDICIYIKGEVQKEIDFSFCEEINKYGEYIIKREGDKYTLYDSDLNKFFNNYYDDIILYDDFCIIEIEKKYYVYSYGEEDILNIAFDDYYYNFSSFGFCSGFYCESKGSKPLLVLSVESFNVEGKSDYINDKFYYFEYKK